MLKSKMFSYFFKNFEMPSYRRIIQTDTQEVYYKKGKLVVFVSEELGRKIYDVVTYLTDSRKKISTHRMDFRITKYYEADYPVLTAFIAQVKWYSEGQWDYLSVVEKMQELVCFVEEMQKIGYQINESRFSNATCHEIASFLSFFDVKEEEISSKGCLLKYIHYKMNEKQANFSMSYDGDEDLDEYYRVATCGSLQVCDFPYALPLITACYNYYKKRAVPEDLYAVLQQEEKAESGYNDYMQYYVINRSDFEKGRAILDDTTRHGEATYRYTIYDGNFKLYHNMPEDFAEFVKDTTRTLAKCKQEAIERVCSVVIDFEGKVIGYCFGTQEIVSSREIEILQECSTVYEIIDYISNMRRYVSNLYSKLQPTASMQTTQFDLESCLKNYNYGNFLIRGVEDLYALSCSSVEFREKQITTVFLKVYQNYLCKKYGEMDTEDKLLEKAEVRYINPVLAKELIAFMLGKSVNYEVASKALASFLCDAKNTGRAYPYDAKFDYDPEKVPYLFTHEVEAKYEVAFKKGMRQTLPDGRQLITFDRATTVSSLKEKEEKRLSDIKNKLGIVVSNKEEQYEISENGGIFRTRSSDHIKFATVSELVCSEELNSQGMYKVLGYITTPIKGRVLTDEVLLSLNNKELYLVIGYLFSKMGAYYISGNTVWLDEDFIFYIDLLDSSFQIERLKNYSAVNLALKEHLVGQDYNPNAFEGVVLDWDEETWIDYANKCDAYCEEHSIYYPSGEGICPACKKTKYFVNSSILQNLRKVEEDETGIHYKLNQRFNLKIYKSTCQTRESLEENAKQIVHEARLRNEHRYLGQECFVPYQIAVDENKKMIGYVYETVSFEDGSCIDLKSPDQLENLARLKSLIRLVLQVQDLMNKDLGFVQNPFSHVYLSKKHKWQVQVLNIEALSSQGSKEATQKWTYKYVCKILRSDSTLKINTSDCEQDLNTLLQRMQDLAKEFTHFCSIHKVYFQGERNFCPKCVTDTDLQEIATEVVEKSSVEKEKPIGEGGESNIYPYGENMVAKVFKQGVVDLHFKTVVLARVMRKKRILASINRKNKGKFQYVIPQKLLIDSKTRQMFAYTMKKVIGGMPLSNLKDKKEIKKLGFTRKDVFDILITVGEGIEILHQQGMYIGDLSGRNILFDSDKIVYFIEFDGMGNDEIAPVFWTDKYIDPVSKKTQNITMKDDWYSFAVQAFYYLTYTHPFNGIYFMDVNGKKQKLEIPEKMEHRISLLGPHGMEIPAIAEPWDWMSNRLITVFLTIFEGDVRVSLLPYLKQEYKRLYEGATEEKNTNTLITSILSKKSVSEATKAEQKNIRINPKFVARKLSPFRLSKVVRVINHYTAVYNYKGEECVFVLAGESSPKTRYKLELAECEQIKDILLMNGEEIAWVIYPNQIIAVDLKSSNILYCEDVEGIVGWSVNDNTLHLAGDLDGQHILLQRTMLPNGLVEKDKIRFLPDQPTKAFLAKFNSKFVLVKQEGYGHEVIYCNNQPMLDIVSYDQNCRYNILYDDASNSYLVINSEGKGVIITSKGECKTLSIEGEILVECVSYRKQTIYIPDNDCLHILKAVNDQTIVKEMECRGIMTPESRLYNINQDGFSVITNNIFYEVRKG